MKFFSSLLLRYAFVAGIALSGALPLVSCKKGDEGAASSDVSYYTCTMHPSVKSQDPKAKCPICSMDLVPVKKVEAASSDVSYYTCTMHPSVKSQDPKAKCPICSMDLVPVKKVKAVSSDVSYYTCTMHPSVKSQDPKAKCPTCSMDLVPVKKVKAASSDVSYYTCTMHPSVKSQDPKAKCPICSMDLVLVKTVKAASSDVSYYTCPMHPSVKSQDPKAKCPTCSMDLVPVKKMKAAATASPGQGDDQAGTENLPGMAMPAGATNEQEQPSQFTVPVERQQQIGVTYAEVKKQPLHHTIRGVGLVAADKQRRWNYVTRVDGYVEKLFVFSPGEIVEKDAPLLTLYSPDLLTTQDEFVDVLKTIDETRGKGDSVVLESTQGLLGAAKRRLRLWNITDKQIAELERTRKPQETLTLESPFKGVVQNLGVDQGRRVMVGDHLVDIADLSVVWVWAQFYENELALLKKGLPVTISAAAYPGEQFSGEISLIDPFLDPALRTARIRIDVDNPTMKLHPEMYVDVEVKMDMGEALAVPVSAVLPTGLRNIVFVDKGGGKLEPRFAELGRKYGDYYEIISGLQEDERVVTSANFLIAAEAKVQSALKSW